MLEALTKAIEILGGQSKAARVLAVSQPTVWYWLRHMCKAPPEKVIQIERATRGRVTREQLRPDLYPPPLKRRAS